MEKQGALPGRSNDATWTLLPRTRSQDFCGKRHDHCKAKVARRPTQLAQKPRRGPLSRSLRSSRSTGSRTRGLRRDTRPPAPCKKPLLVLVDFSAGARFALGFALSHCNECDLLSVRIKPPLGKDESILLPTSALRRKEASRFTSLFLKR